MKLANAVSGASGVVLGMRLLECFNAAGKHSAHALVSVGAEEAIQWESGAYLCPRTTYPRDACGFSATIASSSRARDAMAMVSRLMKTLSAVAHVYSDDLVVHCANAMLRLGRPLALVPRETLLSLPAIEIMQAVKLAGAVTLPPVVADYPKSHTLEQLTDSFAERILKVLRMEHSPYRRWREGDSMSWI